MNKNGINVLSLFDGISCGQIALERAGIKVNQYFASEVDKHAIKVTQHNYPSTIQLGSVTELKSESLPEIDLLIGGSLCQSFSFAGKRKGMVTKEHTEILSLDSYLELKQKGFEFDGQSYLFWEYIRILNEKKPKYFLLENVKMSNKWKDLINNIMGISPILINSSLVSAQYRERLYWTNIPNITQPEDKKIYITDILENPYNNNIHPLTFIGLTPSVRKNIQEQEIDIRPRSNGFFALKCESGYTRNKVGIDKTPTLNTSDICCIKSGKRTYREISTIEAERLQTIPDNYTFSIPKTHRYKAIGNGWTVDVIAHIFKFLND
jgi:DNA (cytosine-5)-methyltransferase 3A